MPFVHHLRFALIASAGLLAGAAAGAGPAHYSLDPVHTRVMFAIDHAGFSKAIGTVSGSIGQLRFDPENWTLATLQASVPLARIDLGDAGWNKATVSRKLLNIEDYPTAEFVSTRVESSAPDRASVHGMLTLRGVSREVVLDVTLNAAKRHPLPPFRRTVGFSATATLSRKAFGIDAWPSVIGDAVELRIEAEATRSRADDDADAPDSPDDVSSGANAGNPAVTEVPSMTAKDPKP
jgi:polyisoprenoid-binding protein YceI